MVQHHAALDWREAPAFVADMARREGIAARALAFAVLTAARSGEVRGMAWREVDLDAAVWTVPAERIKAGREHRVPLAAAALALLGEPGGPTTSCSRARCGRGRPLSGHDADGGAAAHGAGRGDRARASARRSATGPARRRRTRAR
jgi:hypothetical protein